MTKRFLVNPMLYPKDSTRKIRRFTNRIEISKDKQLSNMFLFQGQKEHYKIQTFNNKKVPQKNQLIQREL